MADTTDFDQAGHLADQCGGIVHSKELPVNKGHGTPGVEADRMARSIEQKLGLCGHIVPSSESIAMSVQITCHGGNHSQGGLMDRGFHGQFLGFSNSYMLLVMYVPEEEVFGQEAGLAGSASMHWTILFHMVNIHHLFVICGSVDAFNHGVFHGLFQGGFLLPVGHVFIELSLVLVKTGLIVRCLWGLILCTSVTVVGLHQSQGKAAVQIVG